MLKQKEQMEITNTNNKTNAKHLGFFKFKINRKMNLKK